MASTHFGTWNSKSDVISGFHGGLPLTVFDKAMENTIVISPFTEFMATSSNLDTTTNPRVLQLGVFGKADKVTALKIVWYAGCVTGAGVGSNQCRGHRHRRPA